MNCIRPKRIHNCLFFNSTIFSQIGFRSFCIDLLFGEDKLTPYSSLYDTVGNDKNVECYNTMYSAKTILNVRTDSKTVRRCDEPLLILLTTLLDLIPAHDPRLIHHFSYKLFKNPLSSRMSRALFK